MRRILLALAIGLTIIALPGVSFAASDEETARLLRRDADRGDAMAQARLGYQYGAGLGVVAEDGDDAAVAAPVALEDLDYGGLARAVGPEEPENLALLDAEADPADGFDSAVRLP